MKSDDGNDGECAQPVNIRAIGVSDLCSAHGRCYRGEKIFNELSAAPGRLMSAELITTRAAGWR